MLGWIRLCKSDTPVRVSEFRRTISLCNSASALFQPGPPEASRDVTKEATKPWKCFKCQKQYTSSSACRMHQHGCNFCVKCRHFKDYRHQDKCLGTPVYRTPRVFCTVCRKRFSKGRIARHMKTDHDFQGVWSSAQEHPDVIRLVSPLTEHHGQVI